VHEQCKDETHLTPTSSSGEESIAQFLDRRRHAVADRWSFEREVVLIGAGEPIFVPGRADQTYPFRAHSEYLYLTDRERPGGVLAFDPAEGWVEFVAPVTQEELVWEATSSTAEQEGVPLPRLKDWLAVRRDRPTACLGVRVAGVDSDPALEARARGGLNSVRRQKDTLELDRMRTAERATSAGFAALVALIEPGRTERELQVELEAAFFRNGADYLAFDTIVGGGPNSAVLHFHPSARRLQDGELVLIDAGGEFRHYASDITRTYPVSGQFTPEQAEVNALVHAAGLAAIGLCKPGAEWRDVHRAAALVVAEGLVEFGVLRGEPDALVTTGAAALFFPHGVGHLVGLGIRDAGEVLPGRDAPDDGLPPLRMDLPLLPGFVTTVEPGIYFIPALLGDARLRERHRDTVDWERVDGLLGFGGIRIEQNVLITDDGADVLTADVPVPA
jgi:Xaa-Pro aminopeptidase